eukprot:4894329-Ditylum_brightwellii.AAC.1
MFSLIRPKAPTHMDEFAKTIHKAKWKESMFDNYEKIDTSGTLTAPLLRSDLPSDSKIICTQPAFKVKLQEEANMYEFYTCTAANGASQVDGIDFEASYSPTSFWENIPFLLAIAAAECMCFFTIDVSNVFQTNIEEHTKDRNWLSIPPFYLDWFFACYPDHPLK